ncbi:MAG: GTP-binding protein [Bacteroidota bacterium]
MNPSAKPVTILTGFLGAGKTTFLNHLLQQNKDTRYAIIENEFGEQGIDGELVVRPDETIVELNSGCLCCTLNDNLYDILNELFDRKDAFDEIIIEATGVADPTGLAQPFVAHELIKEYFPLKGVICLVDARQIETHLLETEEAKNQVGFSDVLLINKTDLVTPAYIQELKQRLHTLNPLAGIIEGHKQAFPDIDLNPQQSPLEEIFQQESEETPGKKEQQFPVSKPHSHHHHKHTQEIVSHTFHFDQPFSYQLLDRHLFLYLMLHASGLYRMKGLVWFKGSEDQYLVQSVGNQLDIEKKAAWQVGQQKKSVMVFIGKNLDRAAIDKVLDQCLSKSPSAQV